MIKKSISNCILFVVTVCLSAPVFAKDVSAKVMSYSCNTCHSSDRPLTRPDRMILKGQDANKLEKSLLDFKYDKRFSSIMGRISKGFTDTELKKLALYFSQLKGDD
ncbi:MAG: hypothetical protein HFP77_09805 [Methylococcales symbiont of Iophon sp. n. MRB-2018]|nr:MAG: hypothetical protein HFP77_09805 [Methylococcales symbiont of Iophon sp. n. MRB-2018]KAF3979105.1 MAG: hypothetical protein HFP76_09265 [Methylococcales symbiont of Iophon sp. n. MRB-2018]